MSALSRLMIAGAAAALFSAPVAAMEAKTKLDVSYDAAAQQQTCRGWGVHCELEVTPEYCIAANKCAIALPAAALIRYDQRMDALLAD
jgi:hypothetical protein